MTCCGEDDSVAGAARTASLIANSVASPCTRVGSSIFRMSAVSVRRATAERRTPRSRASGGASAGGPGIIR